MKKKSSSEVAQTIRVRSVKAFTEAVCRMRDEWIVGSNYFDPWFRGQTHSSKPLEPSIFRYDLLESEDEIRAEFQRRAAQYMTETQPADYWGWYFLMQHYGAPTRLLDWTDSALVALFFALNSTPKPPRNDEDPDQEDAVVWMLDPWWLNRVVFDGDESILLPPDVHRTPPEVTRASPYLAEYYESLDNNGNTRIIPSYPVAIDPPFIARRVAVQRSHFTIFGKSKDGLTQLGQRPGAHLTRILIAKEKFERMRADLLTLGISDTSIYPDLRGLADELIRYHLGPWPPD